MSTPQGSQKKSGISSSQHAPASANGSINRKKKLQTLLQEGVNLNERAENNEYINTLSELRNLIENSNTISKENVDSVQSAGASSNASESVMDAAVMKIGHEIIGFVASKLGNNEFSEPVFAESLLSEMKVNGEINWAHFGTKVMHMVKTPRFSQSMVGTFDHTADPVVKAKKERIVRKRATIAELKCPEKVVALQKEEKGAQLLTIVRTQIEKEYIRRLHKPFPYYELILDREDFMHTVDNAFHVAFLIRDGHLGVTVDENDEPVVYVATPEQKKAKANDKKTTQAVVGLNYAKWNQAIERFGQNEPILNLNRSEFIPQSQSTQS